MLSSLFLWKVLGLEDVRGYECFSHKLYCKTVDENLHASLFFRPSHCPVFGDLWYAKMKGDGLVHFYHVNDVRRVPDWKKRISCKLTNFLAILTPIEACQQV